MADHGTLVRFMCQIHDVSCYRTIDSFNGEGLIEPAQHGTYLLDSQNTRIRWVGRGTNDGGGWIRGHEIEQKLLRGWQSDDETVTESDSD